MPNIVRVPWQPSLFLDASTLAYFEHANSILGETLYFNGDDSCLRTYERQAYLYNGYVNHLPGFNVASSPNPPGQRNHMRGAAGDLVRTDDAAQAACRQAGLIRDDIESWHWNNPNWQNMPIISDADIAALTVTQLEEDMPLTKADISLLLNFPAWDGGPTISQALKDSADREKAAQALAARKVTNRSINTNATALPSDGSPVPVIDPLQDSADTNTIVRKILSLLTTNKGN